MKIICEYSMKYEGKLLGHKCTDRLFFFFERSDQISMTISGMSLNETYLRFVAVLNLKPYAQSCDIMNISDLT
jgi:hypothetical protein